MKSAVVRTCAARPTCVLSPSLLAAFASGAFDTEHLRGQPLARFAGGGPVVEEEDAAAAAGATGTDRRMGRASQLSRFKIEVH